MQPISRPSTCPIKIPVYCGNMIPPSPLSLYISLVLPLCHSLPTLAEHSAHSLGKQMKQPAGNNFLARKIGKVLLQLWVQNSSHWLRHTLLPRTTAWPCGCRGVSICRPNFLFISLSFIFFYREYVVSVLISIILITSHGMVARCLSASLLHFASLCLSFVKVVEGTSSSP